MGACSEAATPLRSDKSGLGGIVGRFGAACLTIALRKRVRLVGVLAALGTGLVGCGAPAAVPVSVSPIELGTTNWAPGSAVIAVFAVPVFSRPARLINVTLRSNARGVTAPEVLSAKLLLDGTNYEGPLVGRATQMPVLSPEAALNSRSISVASARNLRLVLEVNSDLPGCHEGQVVITYRPEGGDANATAALPLYVAYGHEFRSNVIGNRCVTSSA